MLPKLNPVLTFVTMALKIYLARHGQDEDNASGILNGQRNQPLTKLGEEQAETVAKKIQAQQLSFDAVYSSPLERAHRTAEILACGKPVKTMDLLIERDFGIMTGVPTKEIKERCAPDLLQTKTISYFLSPKGAETFPDLLERGSRVISEIQEMYKGKDYSILLVTHGDFGKMLYTAYYKLDWVEVLKQFHFGNSEVLLLAEDSSPDQAHVFQIDQYNP
jgi:broad specificity phosphatase PhoE